MDLQGFCSILGEIFGENNVKLKTRDFRIIIEYENMPYCIVLSVDHDRIVMRRDAVDEGEHNYEAAYKKAYKMLASNKNKLNYEIVI
jgi:hypothetical protein